MIHPMKVTKLFFISAVCVLCTGLTWFYFFYIHPHIVEKKVLNQIITRLESETRIAEVIVTDSDFDPETGKTETRIKFLEYDTRGTPLSTQYFTFSDNLLQFQSLVIRFADDFVRSGQGLKGKSAYLFWKVFMLDGARTEEYDITSIDSIPEGYRLSAAPTRTEKVLWNMFWDYALDQKKRNAAGIKNAQIEAPGTLFVPGKLYTLKIEHDGGIRIDVTDLPSITSGEELP